MTQVFVQLIFRPLGIVHVDLVPEELEVPGTYETVASVVPRPAAYQNPFVGDSLARVRFGDGRGAAETGQLHELVHAELVCVEQLLVDVYRF